MKRSRTAATVDVNESVGVPEIQLENVPTSNRNASTEENIVDIVQQLRAELSQKNEELSRKDEELRVAQESFTDLEVCSREVEQELESEIFRLSRLNRELENMNCSLQRRVQHEVCHIGPAQMNLSARNDEMAQLRQQIRHLEQENDDLQMCVRRLEATNEDLNNKLEHAQEEHIFAQQELDSFKDEIEATVHSHNQIHNLKVEVKEHEMLVGCLLQLGIIPYVIKIAEYSRENIKKVHGLDPLSIYDEDSFIRWLDGDTTSDAKTWRESAKGDGSDNACFKEALANFHTNRLTDRLATPEHDDEMAKLREQLRHLEQENDDLQSCVRRLKATQEDLIHRIERAEEEAVFAQHELEIFQENHQQSATQSAEQVHDLTAKLQEYQNVVSRLLSVVGIPNVTQETGKSSDADDELELESLNMNTDDTGEENAEEDDHRAGQFVSSQKWIDVVDSLRTKMRAKIRQLQTTEDSYEEFMVASYEVEKALASENTDLKHLVAALQKENTHLQHLQTERDS